MWFFATQTVRTCESELDSFKITVHERPVVTIEPSYNVCPHDTIILQAVDSDPIDVYHWSPQYYLDDTIGAAVVARPIHNITYRVVAMNKYGCYDTAFTAITVRPGAVMHLGDSVKLYPGESYQLQPQTNCASFAWFPAAGLDNPRISNPVASPQISTKYKVEGITAWGCKASDSISVYVDPETLLTLPNAFAPGTGANGEFKVLRRGIAELRYFRIWDRWGVKVFETTDISKGWDGTFNGKPQPFGVYIYEAGAVTSSGRDFVKHGNVTLIR
jgi:gliding motility-associated-like protein